jgi:DNA-3-methyladenine glycosylase
MAKLPLSFYNRPDVVTIAKELLGKKLMTSIDGVLTGGIITETEAYEGVTDKASHAYNGRRTARTEVMYHKGGTSYVYLCYGIHHLFNVVTNKKDIPHAVLIRAIEPLTGLDTMLSRTRKSAIDFTLTSGPGNLSLALGIHHRLHNGISLSGDIIWIETTHKRIEKDNIVATPRIGVNYAEEDAYRLYRFFIKNNPWVSKSKEPKLLLDKKRKSQANANSFNVNPS